MDGNPVYNSSVEYYKFCFKVFPKLKNIDPKKIVPDIKNIIELGKLNDIASKNSTARDTTGSGKRTDASEKKGPTINIESQETTTTKPTKPLAAKPTNSNMNKTETKQDSKIMANSPTENTDQLGISQECLNRVIAQEWIQGVRLLKPRGINGVYDKKKEIKTRSLVQSGHAEIEDDTILFIYGNALEVLGESEFQKTVKQINFQYVFFDNIIDSSNLANLCKFQKLEKLVFAYNLLDSFLQIAKLECLQHLTELIIEHNNISKTSLFRSFIVYRFNKLITINNVVITEVDRQLSRKAFQPFNHVLHNSFAFKVVWLFQ
jgi:hypothetical protein